MAALEGTRLRIITEAEDAANLLRQQEEAEEAQAQAGIALTAVASSRTLQHVDGVLRASQAAR